MGFYDDMQAVATELLTEFKQGTVTLTRTTAGTVDPDEPWIPVPGDTTVYTLNATVRAVGKEFIDGTTILATDDEIMCSALMTKFTVNGFPVEAETVNLEMLPGDVISIDGFSVTIINTIRVPRAGTAVAWRVVARD